MANQALPLLALAVLLGAASVATGAILEHDSESSSGGHLRFERPGAAEDTGSIPWRQLGRAQPHRFSAHAMHQQRLEQNHVKAKTDAQSRVEATWKTPPENSRDERTLASVLYEGGRFKIVPNKWAPFTIAYGMIANTLNKTGWDVLDIIAGTDLKNRNDTAAMYAAGLLEGYLTADRIALMYRNMMAQFFPDEHSQKVLLPRVRSFLLRQFDWAFSYVAANPHSAFARHTGFVLAQLRGLIDGYLAKNHTAELRDPFVLHLLNAVGDMLDLQIALNNTKVDHFERMSHSEFGNFVQSSGRCSALIRVTPGLEKVFMGHSSWFVYAATMRIYKHYFFNLEDRDMASHFISFSSYPGFLESLDDFYILDSGMVVLQTTNNVFNVSLYKSVKPQSLLAWQRVRVANQIARNGSHWAWAVTQQNSGTYNNQYMVIDLSRIRPNISIDDGALTVIEQIPTLVVSSDQTKILRTGYFPSYNVPFHERIYNMSGYPEVVGKRGLDFSYQLAPRAKIFRREAPKVLDNAGMAGVLRFNQFRSDPYSEGDACNSICCRGDLKNGTGAAPFGCYDTKFTEFQMARYLVSYAISGPSQGSVGQKLPPFSWKQFPRVSHVGLPLTYNFSWVTMSPRALRGRH